MWPAVPSSQVIVSSACLASRAGPGWLCPSESVHRLGHVGEDARGDLDDLHPASHADRCVLSSCHRTNSTSSRLLALTVRHPVRTSPQHQAGPYEPAGTLARRERHAGWIHRSRHHGQAHGAQPAERWPRALRDFAQRRARRADRGGCQGLRLRARGGGEGRGHHHHAARHARRGARALRARVASPRGCRPARPWST